MSNYYNSFNSFAVAAGLPAGFTSRWGTATYSTIDTGAGDIALRSNIPTSARCLASMNAIDADANTNNVEVLIRMRSSAAGGDTYGGAVLCGSGTAGAETSYYAFYGSAGGIDVGYYSAGAFTVIGSTFLGGGFSTASNPFYIRFRREVTGTRVKCRAWLATDAEPATWNCGDFLNNSVTGGGWAGMVSFQTGTNVDWYDIAVGTNGATASFSVAPVITGPGGAAGAASSASSGVEGNTTGPSFSTDVASTFALSGVDAAKFSLVTVSTTACRADFVTAPSFASPTDTGANNVYDFILTATASSGGATSTQSHARTVTAAIAVKGTVFRSPTIRGEQ